MKTLKAFAFVFGIMVLTSCTQNNSIEPQRIIDLSPTITEDMKVRLAGHAVLSGLGVRDSVKFEHLEGTEGLYYLDSYITLFNHAGPHVDAPLHLIKGGAAVDEYGLDRFFGKAKFLNYANRAWDSEITLDDLKKHNIAPDDIVIVYVGLKIPEDPDELPAYTALTSEAAEYLAKLPVKAYATDALGVDNLQRTFGLFAEGETSFQKVLPVHHAFLSRSIPCIEGLYNLEALVNEKEEFVFVGFPLKTTGKAGNAAPMRAAALFY